MTRKRRRAADSLLPQEGEEEHRRFAEALRKSLQPEGVLECALTVQIIEGAWRLQRAVRYEQYALGGRGRAR